MKHETFTLSSNNLSLNVAGTFKDIAMLQMTGADFIVRRRRACSSGSVGA